MKKGSWSTTTAKASSTVTEQHTYRSMIQAPIALLKVQNLIRTFGMQSGPVSDCLDLFFFYLFTSVSLQRS